MKISKNALSLVIVALLTILLYIFLFSLLLVLLSFIPFLNIQIISWFSLALFTLCIFLWIVPFQIISFLYDIPIKSKRIRGYFSILIVLMNVAVFAVFVFWLDSVFSGLSFSDTGLISYISVMALTTQLLLVLGRKIEEKDKARKD